MVFEPLAPAGGSSVFATELRSEFRRETRRLLIGTTDGGRVFALVIEATIDPTTWLLITGWEATAAERRLIQR